MNADTVGIKTTDWAKQHGRAVVWSCALDNHEPTRSFASGRAWFYTFPADDPRGEGLVLTGHEGLRGATDALYLIDDARTVRPYYVAGWGQDGGHVLLQPFPTEYNEHGERRLRADDGQPVSFGSWMLGPRRAYHLKVRDRIT